MEPVISFQNVTKEFYLQDDRTFKEFLPNLILGKPWAKKMQALSSVTFDIFKGETVGIIGKNGAGKSTILKLIAGVTSPTKGRVIVREKVTPLIELGAGFHYELSGYENIFLNAAILGMHKQEIEQVVDKIIDFSELGEFIHTPVKKYSSGMYMRLAFAVAIYIDAPIILIDEVLSVGDVTFQKKCLNYLEYQKKINDKTIIFISHSENIVKKFCDRTILLHHGKIIQDSPSHKSIEKYHQLLKEEAKSIIHQV